MKGKWEGILELGEMKEQGQSCEDTKTMIHIHPSERMMERGQETNGGKVRRVK